jgi:hypothetical protein
VADEDDDELEGDEDGEPLAVLQLRDEVAQLRGRLREAAEVMAEAGKIANTPAAKWRWMMEGR